MSKSLKSISRVQKFNIDNMRKKLNALLTEEEGILRKLDNNEKELKQEKVFANQNPEAIKSFGNYMKRYLQIKNKLEGELKKVRAEIEETKDIIIDMFKEQKTYDIVDERREIRKQKELDAKEQSTLDEIGTNTYIKKRGTPRGDE